MGEGNFIPFPIIFVLYFVENLVDKLMIWTSPEVIVSSVVEEGDCPKTEVDFAHRFERMVVEEIPFALGYCLKNLSALVS